MSEDTRTIIHEEIIEKFNKAKRATLVLKMRESRGHNGGLSYISNCHDVEKAIYQTPHDKVLLEHKDDTFIGKSESKYYSYPWSPIWGMELIIEEM